MPKSRKRAYAWWTPSMVLIIRDLLLINRSPIAIARYVHQHHAHLTEIAVLKFIRKTFGRKEDLTNKKVKERYDRWFILHGSPEKRAKILRERAKKGTQVIAETFPRSFFVGIGQKGQAVLQANLVANPDARKEIYKKVVEGKTPLQRKRMASHAAKLKWRRLAKDLRLREQEIEKHRRGALRAWQRIRQHSIKP